jgi:hypothetical protein
MKDKAVYNRLTIDPTLIRTDHVKCLNMHILADMRDNDCHCQDKKFT